MKKFFTLLLLSLFITLSYGQNNYQDVVYMKNGSIVKGVIVEQIPNQSIKIETADGNTFVFELDKIEKLTKEVIQVNNVIETPTETTKEVKKQNNLIRQNIGFKSSYKGIAEFDGQYVFGYGGGFKFKIINEEQISPYFSMGLGLGVQYLSDVYHGIFYNYGYYDVYKEPALLLPIFSDFRVYFMNNKITPYLSMGIGLAFNTLNYFRPGFLFNTTVGASFKLANHLALNAGIGYELQEISIERCYTTTYYVYNPFYGNYEYYENRQWQDYLLWNSLLNFTIGISW